MLDQLIDIALHLPKHLDAFVQAHGAWTYAVLALIVFCETGLVVLPFLPGDSLLFAAGAIAARGGISVWVVGGILILAAVVGDAVNYAIGRLLSDRVMSGKRIPFVKPSHIERTHAFMEKYGAKAIVLARFVPIVRTFAPFVAGVGRMNYARFTTYNIAGGVLWVLVCVGAGYFFGNLPWVQKNFELVVVGIIIVSVLPMGVEVVLAKRRAARAGM